MSGRFQFSLRTLLVWFVLSTASIGAAFEGARLAIEDRARLAVSLYFLSGAMLGAAIGFTRGRSVIRGAMWGLLLRPAIAMALFLASTLYNGSFVTIVY